jgi:DNA-binding PucR family transcriptional regulator
VATLTSYFHHSGNLARTAAALHVHVNTLLKRLSRADAILGEDWRTPERALQLHVALALHALRTPGEPV